MTVIPLPEEPEPDEPDESDEPEAEVEEYKEEHGTYIEYLKSLYISSPELFAASENNNIPDDNLPAIIIAIVLSVIAVSGLVFTIYIIKKKKSNPQE